MTKPFKPRPTGKPPREMTIRGYYVLGTSTEMRVLSIGKIPELWVAIFKQKEAMDTFCQAAGLTDCGMWGRINDPETFLADAKRYKLRVAVDLAVRPDGRFQFWEINGIGN